MEVNLFIDKLESNKRYLFDVMFNKTAQTIHTKPSKHTHRCSCVGFVCIFVLFVRHRDFTWYLCWHFWRSCTLTEITSRSQCRKQPLQRCFQKESKVRFEKVSLVVVPLSKMKFIVKFMSSNCMEKSATHMNCEWKLT